MKKTPAYKRPDGRKATQLRPVVMEPNVAPSAWGSVLISMGDTRVVCAVSIDEEVPRWLKAGNGKSG